MVSIQREWFAVGAALAFLAMGILTIWIAHSVLELSGDALYITLLVVPVVLYAIVSGRVTEIAGPGGFTAKLVAVAQQPVAPQGDTVSSATVADAIQTAETVLKGAPASFQRALPAISDRNPILLRLQLGLAHYDPHEVKRQIDHLSSFRNFKFVVVVDQDERVIAYAPYWLVRRMIEAEPDGGDAMLSAISQGNRDAVLQDGRWTTRTIALSASNQAALRLMHDLNLEALIAVDEQGRIAGVVEREQLLGEMILALVNGK